MFSCQVNGEFGLQTFCARRRITGGWMRDRPLAAAHRSIARGPREASTRPKEGIWVRWDQAGRGL